MAETGQSGKSVAVIGGGIAGLGVARALVDAAFKVTVFESQSEIAGGTSANSLRIIHGGFRYLQQAAILRIIDSVRDQSFCLRQYPDLVKPLASVMPLQAFGLKSRIPVQLAAWVYGAILKMLGSPLPAPKILSCEQAASSFSWAREHLRWGALQWHDAQLNSHEHLVQKIVQEISAKGARIQTLSEVTSVKQYAQQAKPVELVFGNKQAERFDYCVECMGHRANDLGTKFTSGSALAFNLVFKKSFALTEALGFSGPGGRLFFLVPRTPPFVEGEQHEIALGTEYVPFTGQVGASEEQVQSFFNAAKEALPSLPLSLSDLIRVECGVVPTVQAGSLKLKGRTEIKRQGNIISLLPSKYTTWRSVGERVLKVLQE